MDFKKAPKASEVVATLNNLIKKHGDLPICADDTDTSWRLRIGIIYKPENTAEEWPERFEIKTEYNCIPKGLIGESDEF